jgi:hypothetical protein
MKSRIIVYTFLSLFIAVTIISSKPAHAADITVGVSSWYSWWNVTPDTGSTKKPGLLYGPALAFDFAEKWSISSVFLTGNLDETYDGTTYHNRRYDLDTVVSYKMTRWFKVFAGFKYYRYDYNYDASSVSVFGKSDFSFYSRGPGAGAGVTLPLSDSLFFQANTSFIYCFATFKFESEKFHSREKGINSNISFAYHITPASTTLSGGFRYQYINNHDELDYVTKSYYYGVTFAALYHFSLDDD